MEEEIDIEHLIDLVSQKRIIWDKTLPEYHSRVLTIDAWRNVCLELNPKFNRTSDIERCRYGKIVMKKWRNIRDQWAKACKKVADQKRFGAKAKALRYYVYHEQLRFLNKTTSSNKTESSLNAKNIEPPATPCEVDINVVENNDICENVKPAKKKQKMNFETDILENFQDEGSKWNFFKSILPHITDFTDDEMLQWKSGIINLVQNIRRSRLFQPQPSGCNAHMPASSTHIICMQNTQPCTSGWQSPVSSNQEDIKYFC